MTYGCELPVTDVSKPNEQIYQKCSAIQYGYGYPMFLKAVEFIHGLRVSHAVVASSPHNMVTGDILILNKSRYFNICNISKLKQLIK